MTSVVKEDKILDNGVVVNVVDSTEEADNVLANVVRLLKDDVDVVLPGVVCKEETVGGTDVLDVVGNVYFGDDKDDDVTTVVTGVRAVREVDSVDKIYVVGVVVGVDREIVAESLEVLCSVDIVDAEEVDKDVNGQYVVVVVTIEILQIPESQEVVVKVVTWVVTEEEVETKEVVSKVVDSMEDVDVVTIRGVVTVEKIEEIDLVDIADNVDDVEIVVTVVIGVTEVELIEVVEKMDVKSDVESSVDG